MPNSARKGDAGNQAAAIATALGVAGVAFGGLLGFIAGKTSPSPNRPSHPPTRNTPSRSPSLRGIAEDAAPRFLGFMAGKSNTPSPSPNRLNRPPARKTPSRSPSLPPRRIEEDTAPTAVQSNATSHGANMNKECLICFQNFDYIRSKGGDIHATPCGHLFCHYCIYQCLSANNSCPICRQEVTPEETIKIFL